MKTMERVYGTLSKEDIHTLFEISEQMDKIQDNADKAEAVSDIFTEALERMNNCGSMPTSDKIILNVARVMYDYSSKVAEDIEDLHEHFRNFYRGKQDFSRNNTLYVTHGDAPKKSD